MISRSPRWLLSKDRNDEALRMLSHYHADGNDSDNPGNSSGPGQDGHGLLSPLGSLLPL